MAYLVFLTFAVLFCKVHSQVCSPPILPPLPPCPQPCAPPPCQPLISPCPQPCPQVINPNPCVTTIIDNSVSNALVNALQLMIVSNLIGATVGTPSPCLNNLGPLLDSIICPNPCAPVEIVIPEYPCAPSFEVIPPCIPCNPFGPNVEIIPPCGMLETFPSFCGYNEVFSPYLYTETVTPLYGNCIEPLPCNGYVDTISPIYGVDMYNPICGVPEYIPNYLNYPAEYCPNYMNYPTEICPNFYGIENLAPAVQLAPNMFGGFSEVVSPGLAPYPTYGVEGLPFGSLASLAPNYFGGLTEISPVPLAAEVVLPSAIPAQLTCNFGYTPSSLPCVRVNVEPLPYEPCVCNGYGGPIYY